MDGTFLKELVKVVKDATGKIIVSGKTYIPAGFNLVDEERTVSALTVSTLDSVCNFLKEEVIEEEHFLIKVHPEKVEVFGSLNNDMNRNCYITASPNLPRHKFSEYMSIETMIMYLRTSFATSEKYPDKEIVLDAISKVTDNNSVEFDDDGISQSVSSKTGITTKDMVTLPSKFLELQPIMTFQEVEQPVLPFILRGRKTGDQPAFALFTVEGSNWMVDTNIKIKECLKKNIGNKLAAKTSKYSVI